MDYPNSVAPTDEELLRFALDGEILPDAARTHLEQCVTCQGRLASYKQINAYLLSHLYRSQCPGGEQISLYCSGLLPEDERMSIANHVLDCPLCAAEVEATRHFLQGYNIELPSPSLSPRRLVRRIFARRVVHPQLQLAVRGDASETTWPRQFKAKSVDVSLHLSRTSSREHMLLGILTSTDPAENVDTLEGVPAELYAAPLNISGDKTTTAPLLRTQVDDLGDLVFKPVPPGEYSLIIYLPNREMVIDRLTIE